MDKANKRGGRGRRTRKKTVSDMAGMLGSAPPAEIIMDPSPSPSAPTGSGDKVPDLKAVVIEAADSVTEPVVPLRHPTTPGVFRQTVDPFAEFTGYQKMVGMAAGSKSMWALGNTSFTSADPTAAKPSTQKPTMKKGDDALLDISCHSIRSTASDGNLKQLNTEEPSPQSPPGQVSNGGETWPPPPPL